MGKKFRELNRGDKFYVINLKYSTFKEFTVEWRWGHREWQEFVMTDGSKYVVTGEDLDKELTPINNWQSIYGTQKLKTRKRGIVVLRRQLMEKMEKLSDEFHKQVQKLGGY